MWCRQSRQSLPSFGCKTSDQPRHLNLRLTKCFCLLFRNVGRRRRSAQGEEGSVNTISTPCECQQCGLHSDMGGTEPACRGDGNVVIRAMHGVAEADDSCCMAMCPWLLMLRSWGKVGARTPSSDAWLLMGPVTFWRENGYSADFHTMKEPSSTIHMLR